MKQRVAFIRSGGLGDFILTLPILEQAKQEYDEVFLFTRSLYRVLLPSCEDSLIVKDIDRELGDLATVLPGSDVISFWKDEEWKVELERGGARQIFFPDPRPSGKIPFGENAFAAMGWSWPEDYSKKAWLGNHWSEDRSSLWIHPGSGSPQKNEPLEGFFYWARKWLGKNLSNKVCFSFGEADQDLLLQFNKMELSGHERIRTFEMPEIDEFKRCMASEAAVFLGNDSGPGHLAAALGIPTNLVFRLTEKSVWVPLGPRVRTYQSLSEASRIL